jgi:hypothetical protein
MGTSTIFTAKPDEFLIQLAGLVGKSVAGTFWQLVSMFWHDYWPWIILILVVIVVYELLTWNGSWHYNSRNGFSPGFNRLVGAGFFALYSGIFFAFFHFVFGDNIYLEQVWPYVIHALAFPLTWLTLRKIGFWVY